MRQRRCRVLGEVSRNLLCEHESNASTSTDNGPGFAILLAVDQLVRRWLRLASLK
jgi:hypothetical protein